jgi:hypothetical protein
MIAVMMLAAEIFELSQLLTTEDAEYFKVKAGKRFNIH